VLVDEITYEAALAKCVKRFGKGVLLRYQRYNLPTLDEWVDMYYCELNGVIKAVGCSWSQLVDGL
jgi:hypothetical protein